VTAADIAAALAALPELPVFAQELRYLTIFEAEGVTTAVNLAEPLWRVAEAARAVARPGDWDSSDDEERAWVGLRTALADLDANVEETP